MSSAVTHLFVNSSAPSQNSIQAPMPIQFIQIYFNIYVVDHRPYNIFIVLNLEVLENFLIECHCSQNF